MFSALSYKKNKAFYHTLKTLSLPIILQEFINTTVNLQDNFIVGALGDTSITAVGLANQVFFLYNLILFGISSGSSIFYAQFWGRREVKNIHKVMGVALTLGLFASGLFFVIAYFFPRQFLVNYSKDAAVIESGIGYLKIIAWSYPINSLIACFYSSLRSTGQTRLPMFGTLIALVSNFIFNNILVFGLLGLPRMGVQGAALATLISRVIEVAFVLWAVYHYKMPVAAKRKQYFSFDFSFFRQYIKVAGYVILNEFVWALGTSLYNMAYKEAGTLAQTAVQISATIQNMAFVFNTGMGLACAIMLGNLLGEGKMETARAYSRKFMVLSVTFGIMMGVFIFSMTPLILKLFNVEALVVFYVYRLMGIFIFIVPMKCLNFVTIVGTLRSGGDIAASVVLDTIGVWCMALPLALLGAHVLKLPVYGIYALICTDDAFKSVAGVLRVRKDKWIREVRVQ